MIFLKDLIFYNSFFDSFKDVSLWTEMGAILLGRVKSVNEFNLLEGKYKFEVIKKIEFTNFGVSIYI